MRGHGLGGVIAWACHQVAVHDVIRTVDLEDPIFGHRDTLLLLGKRAHLDRQGRANAEGQCGPKR
jgi:hypothetical protein